MERPPRKANARATPAGGPADAERRFRHGVLAARTVAVSFRAAMESTERHLRGGPEERQEIKDRWRAWALATLEGYATDLDGFVASEPVASAAAADALRDYRDELTRAFEIVRSTVGD